MYTPLIGISPNIQQIRDLIDLASKTDLNIMISGENGVGKELVARELYIKSNKNGKAFIKINCAAVSEELLEKELFGSELGGSTNGDHNNREPLILDPNSVLMLDEIDGLSSAFQSKLFELLQNSEYSPIDSKRKIKTDAWIIASTTQNKEQIIKDKKIRDDPFSILNVIWIYIPPLRDRPEDIIPLIDYYLSRYSDGFHIDFQITSDEFKRLECYSWPGNVREIQNVLTRMMAIGSCSEVLDQLDYSRRHMAETGA